MSQKRVFKRSANKIDSLVKYLETKYKSEGYTVQVLEIVDPGSPGKLFQVKTESEQRWSTVITNLTGLGTAGTVKMLKQQDDLEVEILGGKWLDKAAVAGVSLILLWPLIITSGVGAWKQNKLLNQLDEDAMLYFAQLSQPQTPHLTVSTACPNCRAVITPTMKFCGNCGKQLS